MKRTFLDSVLRGAEALAARDPVGTLPDSELLNRFVANHDPAAFALLIRRHGPLVWGVCRNLLPADSDAEDAFQATFLALVRSAGSIRRTEALAGWLHGVAYRIAMKSRRAAARRKKHEGAAAIPESNLPVPDAAWHQLQAAVHEEVCKLPMRLRQPFVLCGLQGRPQKEAAEVLGWKVGAVSSRLSEARQRLLERLARRGVPAGIGISAAVLGSVDGQAAVPASISAKVLALLKSPVAVSPTVLSLARGVTPMYLTRTKLLAASLVLIGTLTTGIALSQADAQAPPPDRSNEAVKKAMDYLRTHQAPREQWEYKFVPVEKPLTPATLQKVLAGADEEGWNYCGSQELAENKTGKVTPHMVFKRPRVNAVSSNTAETAAAQLAEMAERERAGDPEAELLRARRFIDQMRAQEANQGDKLKADKAAALDRERLKTLELQAADQAQRAVAERELAEKAVRDATRKAAADIDARNKELEMLKAEYNALIRKYQAELKSKAEPPAKKSDPNAKKPEPQASTNDPLKAKQDYEITTKVNLRHIDGKAAAAVLSKALPTAQVGDVGPDSISLTGSAVVVLQALEIARKLNELGATSAADGADISVAAIPLKQAKWDDVVKIMEKVSVGSKGKMITFEGASNTLIVAGPSSAVAEVKKVVADLDTKREQGK